MSNSKLFIYTEALFAVIVWGASFVATKIALQDTSPITIVWLRFLMGVIILGIAVALRKQFALPNKKEWAYFAKQAYELTAAKLPAKTKKLLGL